jgi:glutamate carboxypeptidase
MGHRDTVFPKGESALRPFRIENGRAYGPGVCDMKAGLVMNAFVLAAFHRFGGAPAPLIGLITSDEEIGSPSCRPVIEDTARDARAVLNSNRAAPPATSSPAARGRLHAPRSDRAERPIRAATSRRALGHRRTRPQDHGPPRHHRSRSRHHGQCRADRRRAVGQHRRAARRGADRPALRDAARPRRRHGPDRRDRREGHRSRTSASLAIRGEFHPLVQDQGSKALFAVYQETSAGLGLSVEGEFAGGCADSGFTASVGCPTLCAVGPIGGNAHSPDEYLEVDSIVPRAQAMALTIARLAG